MDKKLYCGAAVEDITPEEFPFPRMIKGVFFGGVVDYLKVRAIAIGSGDSKYLLISFDLVAAPDPEENVPRLSKRTGIPEENILFFGTHAHAAPMVGKNRIVTRPPSLDEDGAKLVEAYANKVYSAMETAVDRAIAEMRPAKFGVGTGKSFINVNRNKDYVSTEDGKRTVRCGLGFNAEGLSDKTLFTMKFEDYDGNPIAFFINYPVHAVVMHMNECCDGTMGISGDIPGVVSGYMEDMFEGAVAMWTSGSAGDQNPIMMNHLYYPDPKTGVFVGEAIKGGDAYMLKVLSTRHLDDVLRTLEGVECLTDTAEISSAVDWSYTPGRDAIPVDPSNPFSESKVVTEGADPYDIRMQMLRIGDVALLGLSGELYTSISLHLKEISPLKNTVIVTHCSSAYSRSGYIYDDDAIERRALHHNKSRILPGYVKDEMSRVMIGLLDKTHGGGKL